MSDEERETGPGASSDSQPDLPDTQGRNAQPDCAQDGRTDGTVTSGTGQQTSAESVSEPANPEPSADHQEPVNPDGKPETPESDTEHRASEEPIDTSESPTPTNTQRSGKPVNPIKKKLIPILAILAVVVVFSVIGLLSTETPEQKRERIFTDYIAQQEKDYGWPEGSITYEDGGEWHLSTITFTLDSSLADGGSVDLEGAQTEAEQLAEELNSLVRIYTYTSDGFLVGFNNAAPSEIPDEEKDEMLQEGSDDFEARFQETALRDESERNAALQAWCDKTAAENEDGFALVDFQEMPDQMLIMIAIVQNPGYTTIFEDPDEQEAFDEYWQSEANRLACATGRNVSIGFTNPDTSTREQPAEKIISSYFPKNFVYGVNLASNSAQ